MRRCLLVLALLAAALAGGPEPARPPDAAAVRAAPTPARPPERPHLPPPAAAAPADLPVIDYRSAPRGFPADPAPRSTAVLTLGLHPTTELAVYDRPGGRPRAFLPRSIGGLPVVVPIVRRSTGWVAVLLPSVNRRMGWLPATGWTRRPLRDQLVVRRRTHELTWIRDGTPAGRWTVAVGRAATPTPPGRTFVLGRTAAHGAVYGGLDALALGSVPDDRRALSPGLRGAHTGIHSWYRDDAFGRHATNGCIRVPKPGQRALLRDIAPGTAVVVLD